MKERDFQTEFGKRNKITGVFELKLCKGKSLSFSALAAHQELALMLVTTSGLYHKISDFPIFSKSKTRFTKPKPFDCVFLSDLPAFVVVMFWIPRKKKNVYYIPIAEWVKLRESVERKSITEEMANEKATISESYLKGKECKI